MPLDMARRAAIPLPAPRSAAAGGGVGARPSRSLAPDRSRDKQQAAHPRGKRPPPGRGRAGDRSPWSSCRKGRARPRDSTRYRVRFPVVPFIGLIRFANRIVLQCLIRFANVMPDRVTDNSLRDYLTVIEAAEQLGVSPSTLRNWDRSGKLAALRHPVNGYRLYRRSDLAALLKRLSQGKGRK
jgi:MerR family transcriptional regulator, copper efflux regulator